MGGLGDRVTRLETNAFDRWLRGLTDAELIAETRRLFGLPPGTPDVEVCRKAGELLTASRGQAA